jgi:hypothetical protein
MQNVSCYCKDVSAKITKIVFKRKKKMVENENPNEIANKILNEYLEGKSFGFIKSVCNDILSVFDNNVLTETEIKSYNTIQETISSLRQLCL